MNIAATLQNTRRTVEGLIVEYCPDEVGYVEVGEDRYGFARRTFKDCPALANGDRVRVQLDLANRICSIERL